MSQPSGRVCVKAVTHSQCFSSCDLLKFNPRKLLCADVFTSRASDLCHLASLTARRKCVHTL